MNATIQEEAHSEFARGLRAAAPVLIGLVPAAMVLGAQATAKGMAPPAVALMAGLNFAGGSEFAAVGLWTSPPHLLLIAGVTLLVNSRHLVMGAALTPWLRHLPRRLVLPVLFLMVDESWAMALADAKSRHEGRLPRGVQPALLPRRLGRALCQLAVVHGVGGADRAGAGGYQPAGASTWHSRLCSWC